MSHIPEYKFAEYEGLVAAYCREFKSDPILSEWVEDLPALFSHWLISGARTPPIKTPQFAKIWERVLSKITPSIADEGGAENDQFEFPFSIRVNGVPFPSPSKESFDFIDLFAGIGGFRLGLQANQGRCVFSSEWDKAAQKTYFKNFGEFPYGDIRRFTDITISDKQVGSLIPDHDVLAAGFPCQPFSRAGVSARQSLGQDHGFACEAQGTLFFDIVRIAKIKRPKVLFLENVRNLISHDKGKTFKIIQKTIEEDLGYSFSYKIINASTLVPQKRRRCYMVCLRDRKREFEFPSFDGPELELGSILEKGANVKSFTISEKMWLGHINRTKRNLARGTGFTADLAVLGKPSNTLVARYGKDGKECLIPQKGLPPRMLTPRECARLQGFPETYVLAESKAAAYRQFGNSVAVPVIERIAASIKQILPHIK